MLHLVKREAKMSKEYLKQILEQEEQADRIKREGLMESKRVLSAANDEAAALIERTRLEADALYKKTLAVVNEDVLAEYDKIINKANWECDMLMDIADKHFKKAVSVIVGKVVN
jgi:vacuolar-type H+-ATPase subunit H